MPRRTEKASQQLTLSAQENQRKSVRFSDYGANMNAPFCTYFLIQNLIENDRKPFKKGGVRKEMNVSTLTGARQSNGELLFV